MDFYLLGGKGGGRGCGGEEVWGRGGGRGCGGEED